MAINFDKTKRNNFEAIKDIAGFTFTTKEIEGFGFITKNDRIIITIILTYDNGTAEAESIIIDEYREINSYSPIKEVLKEYFNFDVEFIKVYKDVDDMNIIVDLEME